MTSHLTDISHNYNFYSELFVMQLLGSLLYAKNVFHESADSLQGCKNGKYTGFVSERDFYELV